MRFYLRPPHESTEINCESFLLRYENEYKATGNMDFEDNVILPLLNAGNIDLNVVLWKNNKVMGDYNPETDTLPNARGKAMVGINAYIERINNEMVANNHIVGPQNIQQSFVFLSNDSPVNFGTVNIINLMFFLSSGQIPIYDQFAHIAAKAIYFEKHPNEIYVGGAPQKSEITKAVNMLNEYMYLLTQIFGTYSITRQQDRALWAYGHYPQPAK